ncbi:hypothetical protein F5890DRAFT_1479480, partial [Lentinula detonsa]
SQSAYQNHYEDIFWGIQNWLVNEGKRRQQEMSNLKLIAPQITVPQQSNSYDCGLFTLNFILACAQGKDEFPFDQSNCSQLRRKMCWELANVLREVEDINLDPAKEDLEPQSEPLGHVTSQRLNIASVELRSSGLTDAVRCDDPGVQ